MRQAIHILKKDVRHLRFEIAIAISVAALFAFIETKHALWPVDVVNSATSTVYLASLLLPVAWWMLIGRVIHDEALPGDRQFWITRPYSWRSLLSAKLLFILAFVNVPMLIAQMVIVDAYGFSVGAELPALLWSQVLLTIVFVLPVLAMSALTNSFVQLIAGILTPCVVALALASFNFRPQLFLTGFAGGLFAGLFAGGFVGGHAWVKSYLIFLIIILAALAIILWQYCRRGTMVARCFAAGAWILVAMVFYLVSWSATFRIDSARTRSQVDLSSVRLLSDLGDKKPHISFRQGDGEVSVNVPIQIVGLPSGTIARIEAWSASFQTPDGTKWNSDGYSTGGSDGSAHGFFMQSGFYGGSYLTRNDVSVKVHGTVYLAVFGNVHTTPVPFGEHTVPVQKVGLCSANEDVNRENYSVICNSAFRYPAVEVFYQFVRPASDTSKETNRARTRLEVSFYPFMSRERLSFSPFPADLRISPVGHEFELSNTGPFDHALVGALEPLGYIQLDFNADLGRATMYRNNNNEKIRPPD